MNHYMIFAILARLKRQAASNCEASQLFQEQMLLDTQEV